MVTLLSFRYVVCGLRKRGFCISRRKKRSLYRVAGGNHVFVGHHPFVLGIIGEMWDGSTRRRRPRPGPQLRRRARGWAERRTKDCEWKLHDATPRWERIPALAWGDDCLANSTAPDRNLRYAKNRVLSPHAQKSAMTMAIFRIATTNHLWVSRPSMFSSGSRTAT